MILHIDERAGGDYAFYIDGDLQFDTSDEALYHEALVLPALCLARPASADGLRVLICGGGDGLALREVLRFPGVAHVDLVDYSAEVVALGRTRFAGDNRRAFDDARVAVHIADAWEYLSDAAPYDAVICDFTVPRCTEDARVFTREWYARVSAALAPGGIGALNAVSPQTTPAAFWCVRKTVRAAGLHALPYRVCLPSFREQGYGAWAFMLASHRPLRQAELRTLACPVDTVQADLGRLWRGARFGRAERLAGAGVPVHTLDSPCLMRLLLNPALTREGAVPRSEDADPYDLDPLIAAIPVQHPYHTRAMVETLAQQVVGSLRTLDIRRLLDAVLERAARLPGALLRELRKLSDYLADHMPDPGELRTWGYRVFAALVITMVIANAVAPDNAFAKGSSGLGHASFSRGVSGSFGHTGEFGAPAGRTGSLGGIATSSRVSGRGFRGTYRGRAVDAYGQSYAPRTFYFYGHGYHGAYGSGLPVQAPQQQAGSAETHQATFVADDDLMVLDNGDVVMTLSDAAFIRIVDGQFLLMSSKSAEPLLSLYPDPNVFKAVREELVNQKASVQSEIGVRRDWLSWVGWTSALLPAVREDEAEVRNMADLIRRLDVALKRIGAPPAGSTPTTVPPGTSELFVDCHLRPSNRVALRLRDGWIETDGARIEADGKPARKCPPELAAVIKGVMAKLQKELAADIASDDNDAKLIEQDRVALQKDLAEYQSIWAQSGYESDYEVDYGTDSIPASEAIQRTQNDIAQNATDAATTQADRVKAAEDLRRVTEVLPYFGQ